MTASINDEEVGIPEEEEENEPEQENEQELGIRGAPKGSVLDMVHELHERGPKKRRDNELLQLIEEALEL